MLDCLVVRVLGHTGPHAVMAVSLVSCATDCCYPSESNCVTSVVSVLSNVHTRARNWRD